MLSGNGRHRRPRQAPALLVAAGVTGSAIAIPLLGAGAASAADGETWDRVAECESGGSWSQNTGNGYYGGLQLTQDDWENYGGLEYAPSADAASRNQQITVAERILADQGVGKWRACGLLTGLNQDTASPNVDPGVPAGTDRDDTRTGGTSTPSGSPESSASSASPSPSAASGSSDSSDEAKGDADAGASPSASATPESDESDKSGQSADSSAVTESEDSGSGRHRGPSAQEDETADAGTPSSGRHASPSADTPAGIADDRYTVQGGDSLTSIADSLALTGGWTALYVENQQVIGDDPDLILPGQRLLVDTGTAE
ncbi:transglycosylase family protein [Streptomyces griseoincarnatus]|uniref:LysM peptidoglycan-binding domain-containing protein n=1 Tax=unclassified Streptomyces TaxID=2593676 RepID=UPI000C88373A|nr:MULTISPECIES: transglycosylase family protein [unclassified Streptomyces]MBJ6645641.1 LysM peptidoglycan-binding domain-containing protein [Streptomyces sp. BSE7-9]MCA2203877.1 LysM peptidoglycan-binding domain-containing protein [Streptomyces sp. SMS_SU21]NEA94759.1 LysM peptidoglycan-binding domain-containing protein [Actinospica acidiphila]